MHRPHSRTALPTVVALLALLIAAAVFFYRQRVVLEKMQEDITYSIHPSAALAFEYGQRHFDAIVPQEYDLPRAEHFFTETLRRDPNFPVAHFELARIAFLRSDFTRALALVDQEFALNKDVEPRFYYVRALIEGYSEDYKAAEKDYETYFKVTPANWASINDYSWILLKDKRPEDAHYALSWGIKQWPWNAWLLSNDATALYELGRYPEAAEVAKKAVPAVDALSVADWLIAYPGNDPLIASAGLAHFKETTRENLQKILAKAR